MFKSVTLTVSHLLSLKMMDFYMDYKVENDGEYIALQAKVNGVVVTIYTSKKENQKVTFVGDEALQEARIWDKNAKLNVAKPKVKEEWLCLENQIGSDEVGVGDFLLPMVVCASFVRNKDLKMLKTYGITDSKKMDDKTIMEVAPLLLEKFFFSVLVLQNEKYNEMIEKGENLNSLKAKMHNRALLNLYKKFPDTKHVFVDQFCEPEKYFSYLDDKNEMQVRNITFKCKGESYYPSVALASVMARYTFLIEKEKLEKKLKVSLPNGASSKADEVAKQLSQKLSTDEFKKLVKSNFVNYKNLTSK